LRKASDRLGIEHIEREMIELDALKQSQKDGGSE